MAKPKPRKHRPLDALREPVPDKPKSKPFKPPVRWDLIGLFLLISLGGSYLVLFLRTKPTTPQFTYEVLRTFPHDTTAFTQGLLIHDGFLWESTGKKGKSKFRKIILEAGEEIQSVDLDAKYFGEGLAWHNGHFYQITWQEHKCFVYNEQMEKVREFTYEGEGWGLTSDGTHLIMSDGSSILRFFDPETFEEKRRIPVRLGGFRAPVPNELEYIDGKIYANVWMRNLIYVIHPATGEVVHQIDLDGLWPQSERPEEGVLNGIAFNPKTKKILLTGKYAPKIWEIEVVPIKKR